jgi:hypothetical protein
MYESGKAEGGHMARVAHLRSVKSEAPDAVNGKVMPRRPRNGDVRSREHLTPDEVERLMAAAGCVGRHGHRDATLILWT